MITVLTEITQEVEQMEDVEQFQHRSILGKMKLFLTLA